MKTALRRHQHLDGRETKTLGQVSGRSLASLPLKRLFPTRDEHTHAYLPAHERRRYGRRQAGVVEKGCGRSGAHLHRVGTRLDGSSRRSGLINTNHPDALFVLYHRLGQRASNQRIHVRKSIVRQYKAMVEKEGAWCFMHYFLAFMLKT